MLNVLRGVYVKFSKTVSIEESHLTNIKDIMVATGKNFAQVTRDLIGLGLQKYYENQQKQPITTTVVTSEKEKPPPVEKIKWDKVGKQKKV